MFDKYLICEGSLRNVDEGGQRTGFEIQVRITSYRGLRLSLVEGFDVTVDGESFPREKNIFIVNGRKFTFAEMEAEIEERWEMGEPATLQVPTPGGLSPGRHEIAVTEFLRISYVPVISEGKDKKTLEVAA